ncbi:adenylate/guanylate cyclase domain-containing protein [Aliisedimentitalea scapharcae]|uniref:Adenylate/guanylate cyclase domain-containing protein n=1 Tax=Aliisedimentitalea scapharcae TaxID=1524259 RepID=A0ABZ2XQD0_9RHOB
MTRSSEILASLPSDTLVAALELIDFMLGEALLLADADDVLIAMSERIRAAGVPLERATSIVSLLHAEAVASARFWELGKGTRSFLFPYSDDSGEGYAHSPAADVHRTGQWVDLWLPETPDDRYGIVAELKQDGYTQYVMAPVFMKMGRNGTFSFATRAPEGFSKTDLAFLRAVFPALAACQDILATSRSMQEVLRIYVGEEPHRRILSGDVHRGDVMHIRAVILLADMRRFTELTAEMSARAATDLLNAYFDCVVPPVEEAGGEVLKFMGDGVLAIFRVQDGEEDACERALVAAREVLARVRQRSGEPTFDVGIALHAGEVAFGNVGAGMRLDYTVIGRDVNLVARLAGLCSSLDEPLLVFSQFRTRLRIPGRSCGAHRLKGLSQLEIVYAV